MPIGLYADRPATRDAATRVFSDGALGLVRAIPEHVHAPAAVFRTDNADEVFASFGSLLPRGAWIESLPIHDNESLAGMFVLVGSAAAGAAPLAPDERGAIRNAALLHLRSYSHSRRNRQLEREIKFLGEAGESLSSASSLLDRLKGTVVAAHQALGFDSIQLITWNPTRESLLLNVFYVKDIGFLRDTTWDTMEASEVEAATEQFRRNPEPMIIPDPAMLDGVTPPQRAWMLKNEVKFLVFVPLIHEGEQYGTLVMTSHFSRERTEQRLRIFSSLGGQLAAILRLSLLVSDVEESYARLRRSHFNTIQTLAEAAEMRDATTGQHLRNLRYISGKIGRAMGLSSTEIEDLGFAAVVHDIGKLHVPDAVLLKPGRLDAGEWEIIRRHTTAGEHILERSELPEAVRAVVRSHHERWDGTGYPDGLSRDAIPLSVQIVSVADVFDALISKRPYKEAWSVERAIDEIARGSGIHFSPDVVGVFLGLIDDLTFTEKPFPEVEIAA